jgi:perosamine synthetase
LFKDFGREQGGGDNYTTFGINLKYTDLQAAIGIEQVKKLPQRVERKKEMYSLYKKLLYDVPGVWFLPTDLSQTAPWFIDILVDDRDKLGQYLLEKGIKSRAFYPALHQTPVYKLTHNWCKLPVSEDVAKRGLWLPSSLTLTDEDIRTVCTEIERFYAS